MEEVKRFSHGCELSPAETVVDSICNVCYKDEAVELACKSCNFYICKNCSKLPERVYHEFHPEHSLKLCLFQYDRKPKYIVCSGCGNMSSGSYYECKTCEIYLDLGCAVRTNIFKAWDTKEMLHDSHVHLLRRCRPGPDAKGYCLLCELPLSPSSICYGCVYCYFFVHHDCIYLPKEIHHPVHPAHPLRRLSYLRTYGGQTTCDACKLMIYGVPYSCIQCDFDIHMRCADSLLRGLMHKSHKHRLLYVPTGSQYIFGKDDPCRICMGTKETSLESYYHCVECRVRFHFECLVIPESLVKRSFHIHPLVCKLFLCDDESLEYCGVCETMLYAGRHVYSCHICDFLAHIECILRKEEPSPLYLKDLYLCGKDVTETTNREKEDHETNKLDTKLMVNGVRHIHVMKTIPLTELDEYADCKICEEKIFGSPCKCTICSFQTHYICAELGEPSKTRLLHQNHPLTLLPTIPTWGKINCDNCKQSLWRRFNLVCRTCGFVIDISCALKGKHYLGMLGKKVIGQGIQRCLSDKHMVVEVIISKSCLNACAICSKKMHGKGLSCMRCEENFHRDCLKVWKTEVHEHPFHLNHGLQISPTGGAKCIACKMNIAKHGYECSTCNISFHVECIKAVEISRNIRRHTHYFYSFWVDDDLRVNQACSVCARPCGASFYGCVDCNFNAHVECIGIPDNVKSHRHQHPVVTRFTHEINKLCSRCGSGCVGINYFCNFCGAVFHNSCLISLDDREAATIEEQICDIYLMYIERDLLGIFQDMSLKFGSSSMK